MRKHFIDNLRWIAVLLLFPYHTAMIYNGFGEGFYVQGAVSNTLTGFILVVQPWFMPFLFVLAGISTRYALENRTPGQYIKERTFRLFIPLLTGILLLVPIQTYFAERFHNGYTSGYLAQYKLFFGRAAGYTEYSGGFTLAHLWFIFYLFIISMVALPLILLFKKIRSPIPITVQQIPLAALFPLCLITLLFSNILNFDGKSIGEYFALFMWGYLLLWDESMQKKLEQYRWHLTIVAVLLGVAYFFTWRINGITTGLLFDIRMRFYGWVAVLALLGLGKAYLNFKNKFTAYMSAASFPVYILHQSALVAVAFYVLHFTDILALQFLLILVGSIVPTFLCYELLRRTKVTRFILGIKPPTNEGAVTGNTGNP